jgi:hypothetical protein
VCSTDKADDFFVVDTSADNDCDSTAGVAQVNSRLEYDDNDVYLGAAGSMTTFESLLSAGDTVSAAPYDADDADQSTFTLTNVTNALTVAAVTSPVDAASQTVTGTGNPGWEVVVYNDLANNGTYESANDAALTAATPIGPDGDWSVSVPLAQNTTNNLVVVQRAAGSSITSAPADAGRDVEDGGAIVEGPAAQPNIASVAYANGGVAAALDGGDTLTLDFDVAMSGDFGGDSIQVTDGVDTATLTHGGNATFSLTGGGDIVITINGPLGVTINGPSALNNPVGFQSGTGVVLTAATFNVDVNRNFTVA